jgi:DNA-binding SARP family transcriptional activator
MMNGDHLQLLNSFQLSRHGAPVPLPMSAQRLLALLAVQARPLRRGYVAGVLWLDSSQERAFASLRSALWRLQRAGGDLVDAHGSELRVHPSLDVDLPAASDLARAVLDGAAVRGLDTRWEVLTGDLLPGWDDDWVTVEREHQRHLSLQAMELLAERMLAVGDLAQALKIALAVYAREPLRESAHRLLVRIHLAAGNCSEAIRQYRMYEQMTLAALGLPPSPQMDSLVCELLSGRIAQPGAAA